MAWAARAVRSLRPAVHTDISSHLHFCAIVSAFVPVMHYEYRPPRIRLPGLECRAGDLLSLPMEDDSVPSLSCMHVIEHIGLGRYGDALDAEGDHKALAELRRVVAPGGSLLIAVPVGRPRVAFNAHRVYAFRHIVDRFPTWDLRECALVSDDPKEGLMTDATETEFDRQSYGCGCFWFVKPTR
jgi:SAM-dependent methyltransferase